MRSAERPTALVLAAGTGGDGSAVDPDPAWVTYRADGLPPG